ncbi:hypothetical protein HPO96_22340 [Kribbella sandramycini]|uniref:ABC-type branched-subunit amino acid transport system substrate-binding protein n=1 Tax=Kribbella sandramycini TaxID=60450 RepID=A0A7Y4L4E8_9ACTN|nr:hypothetical protein [Kribbella sandramycini]MBB6566347.1 hypothetical protein [Kribbella sandramycini]NOL42991.1 hypothetical protein [Kribbella sandramycini]
MADRVPLGFSQLAECLAEVYRRRSLNRFDRSLRHARDESLPIFACVQDPLELQRPAPHGQPASPVVLRMLSDRLRPEGAKSPELQVPHFVVGLEDKSPADGPDAELQPVSTAEVDELVQLLDRATTGLKDNRSGGYVFSRYDLIRWLMGESFADAKQVRRALYRRAVGGVGESDGVWARIQLQLPGWLQVLTLWLLPTLFWLRHSGRVPMLSGTYRWLRNQPYVARGDDNLFELARRVTKDKRPEQDPERFAGLLVNAFLEDLRAGFRPVEWVRRHRATHPILMVGPISRTNGGYLLVRMVAEVRNDTMRFDPLLLVTIGRKVPPLALDPGEAMVDESVAAWRARHLQESLRHWIGAWLLVFPIGASKIAVARRLGWWPRPVVSTEQERPVQFQRVIGPLWRRRPGGFLIIASVFAVLASTYAGFGVLDDRRHCGGDGFTWLGIEAADQSVAKVDGDCVGVTDGTNALLFPSQTFAPVRNKILEQNRQAAELSKQQPDRPLISLVFLASTTDRSPNEGVFIAEGEQLAGLAVAQAVQLGKPAERYEPILRILIANAGPQFRHADRVAGQLGALSAEDPSIVAVLGLVESRESTQEMVRKLAAVGLPTVAAVLTADQMVDVSRMYLQISPQNRREAAVAAAHVRNLLATGKDPFGRRLTPKLTVYKSDDPTDTYSQNLADDALKAFRAIGVPGTAVSYNPKGIGLDATQAGVDACDHKEEIVFFAGRGQVDFQAFLGGIQDRCRVQPPYVVGGSDTTKYVADRGVSGLNKSVPFQYLALALAPDLLTNAPPQSADFYARLQEMFQYEKTERGRSLDGYAALSYDAAYTVVLAASHLRRENIAVNGGTVRSALQSITDADGGQRSYQGVTGRIDFGGSVSRRVPVDKPVAIVTFERGGPVPRATIVCGPRAESPAWCPVD